MRFCNPDDGHVVTNCEVDETCECGAISTSTDAVEDVLEYLLCRYGIGTMMAFTWGIYDTQP